jgi:ribosomal protein S18 acetylase RimI-like enzyme
MTTSRVQEFLSQFTRWASGRGDIQAVALVGSHARGTQTEKSDVDLVIVADRPSAYLNDRTWADTFGTVTNERLEDHGKVISLRVQYGDNLEVEFGLTDSTWSETPLDPGTRDVLAGGAEVLFERDSRLSRHIAGLVITADTVRIVERPLLTDDDLNELFAVAWESHTRRSFASVLQHSLTYFAAYVGSDLVGFVNVAWDGGQHAFLLDPTVRPGYRRRGIGTQLVRAAAKAAAARGAEWLHVDYEEVLEPFYRAAGFEATRGGLMRLSPGHATE